MEYTECEKAKEVRDYTQQIGEFINWLASEKEVELAKWDDTYMVPYNYNIEKLLAEFYDIDLDKMEEEKRHMLEECRKLNQ